MVAPAEMSAYRVVVKRDESGAWIARVPSVRGCHTYGRSLDAAERKIREALSLFVEDADDAELDLDIQVGESQREAIEQIKRTRSELERLNKEARASTAATVKTLVNDGMSRRDVAKLLELSHQRVQQLVES